MTELAIDVERFVTLTLAMAATACAPSSPAPPRPKTIVAVPQSEPAPSAAPEPEPAPSALPEPEAAKVSACDNDVGEVSCAFVDPKKYSGPACEGFDGTCDLLRQGYGYRKRAAAAAARCFEAMGTRACDIFARKRCFRRSFADACPDASFEPFCKDALARCQDARQRPDFDLDECVKALSSLEGGNLDWAKSAIGPSAEGCKLMFPVY